MLGSQTLALVASHWLWHSGRGRSASAYHYFSRVGHWSISCPSGARPPHNVEKHHHLSSRAVVGNHTEPAQLPSAPGQRGSYGHYEAGGPAFPAKVDLRQLVERGQIGESALRQVVDENDGSDDGASSSETSLAEGNEAGWRNFKHIIEVAHLFPSQRLILYVPVSAGVNAHAFTNAVADYFEPPPSTRELSLIFGSGNHIGDIGEALPKRRRHWENVEMVLTPNSDGKFTYTHTPPRKYRPPPPDDLSPEATKAMKEVLPWLTIPARAYNYPTTLQYWGLACLPYAGEDEAALAYGMGRFHGFMQGYLEGWEEAQDEEEGTASTKRKGKSDVGIIWEEEYWDCELAWVKEVWDMA